MPSNRIPKKILLEQISNNEGWMVVCRQILTQCEHEDLTKPCSIDRCSVLLKSIDEKLWKDEVLSKPKLRLYVQIKKRKCTENYVTMNLTPSERSFIAQLRFGILPLAIETGRFSRTPVANRICPLCSSCTEDEVHFLFLCPMFASLRECFFKNFHCAHLNYVEMLDFFCTDSPRKLAKFVSKCFELRKMSYM